MRTITPTLQAHLQQETQTLATCWRIELNDVNSTVMGFTDHDRDIVVSGLTYEAALGFSPSAARGTPDAAADNIEVDGIIDSTAISESDLLAGRYDYAKIIAFIVNYEDPDSGAIHVVTGTMGEVSADGVEFKAQLLGLSQRLEQNITRIYGSTCDATLGDTRCGFQNPDIVATVTAANTDRMTFDLSFDYTPSALYDGYDLRWKLDETSGTTAFNDVSNTFDGLYTGVTLNQAGPYTGSKSVQFGGLANQHVYLDDNGSNGYFPLSDNDWSMSFWAKSAVASPTGDQYLVHYVEPGDVAKSAISVKFSGSKLEVFIFKTTGNESDAYSYQKLEYLTSADIANIDAWNYFTFVWHPTITKDFNDSSLSVYVNGVELATTRLGTVANTIYKAGVTHAFVLGGRYNGYNASIDNFNGYMSDFIVYRSKILDTSLVYAQYKGLLGTVDDFLDDHFKHGFVQWVDGENAGLISDVKGYTASTKEMVLYEPMGYNIAIGDKCLAKRGCDRRFDTCVNTFNNAKNFRGYPHIPGLSQLVEVN